jgi:hypothetical protein
MSVIPHRYENLKFRKPDTPKLQYFALGAYPKEINVDSVRKKVATPGLAAKINA